MSDTAMTTPNCRIVELPAQHNSMTVCEKDRVDQAIPIAFGETQRNSALSLDALFKTETCHPVSTEPPSTPQKTRNRKSKAEWAEEHEAFLVLAKDATPRLLIMRELALNDVAFNRHYLDALRKGEISPIADGTVFKPSAFPKEVRQMLGCVDLNLISVEHTERGLLLIKI